MATPEMRVFGGGGGGSPYIIRGFCLTNLSLVSIFCRNNHSSVNFRSFQWPTSYIT